MDELQRITQFNDWLRKEILRMLLKKQIEINENISGLSTMPHNTDLSNNENALLVFFTFFIMLFPPCVLLALSKYFGVEYASGDAWMFIMTNSLMWFAALVVKPDECIFKIDIISIVIMFLWFIFHMAFLLWQMLL